MEALGFSQSNEFRIFVSRKGNPGSNNRMKTWGRHIIKEVIGRLRPCRWAGRLVLLLVGLCGLAACSRPTAVAELDAADSLMERRPDSALALLRRVDTLHLTSTHDRARYAMLLSMALDKNYIDLKDFHVLQPALNYYEDHGTPTEQLRTFYYQGRIYWNVGDMSKALQMFLKALERGKDSPDFPTKARAYFAQLNPYIQLNSFDKAIEAGKQALVYNRRSGRVDSYAHCLMDIANVYTMKLEADSAWKYLNECRALYPRMSAGRRYLFYNNYLIAVYAFCGAESIRKAIAEYTSHVPPSRWDNPILAYAYAEINDFEKAHSLISRYKQHTSASDDQQYYSVLYHLYQKQGKYKEAGEAILRFYALHDSIARVSLRESARLSEAQQQLKQDVREAQQARVRHFWIAVCCALALVLLVVWGYYRLRLTQLQKRLAEEEKERYRRQNEQLTEEYQSLQQLLERNDRLNARAREAVSHRLTLLNDFIKAHLAGDGSESESRIVRQLADKETFMQSVREAFAVSHPDFIRRLQDHGLTDWEVGYCCLYALGLSGKEVGRYINSSAYYKTNSIIRKKLELDSHSTNLNLYIRQLMEAEEKPTS